MARSPAASASSERPAQLCTNACAHAFAVSPIPSPRAMTSSIRVAPSSAIRDSSPCQAAIDSAPYGPRSAWTAAVTSSISSITDAAVASSPSLMRSPESELSASAPVSRAVCTKRVESTCQDSSSHRSIAVMFASHSQRSSSAPARRNALSARFKAGAPAAWPSVIVSAYPSSRRSDGSGSPDGGGAARAACAASTSPTPEASGSA